MKRHNWHPAPNTKTKSVIPSSREIKVVRRGYKRLITVFLTILFSLSIWWYIQNRSAWIFTQTEYVGIENLSKEGLDNLMIEYLGEQMNKINPQDLERKIKENFIEVSEIRAEKIFPNKIRFVLIEKDPIAIYINLNGGYIIDSLGEVLRAGHTESTHQFSDLDYEIARGLGSANAEYVEDRIYSELTEEEMSEFLFEEYDYEKKEEVLKVIESERKSKLNDVLESSANESLWEVGLKTLPVINAWDESLFEKGDYVDVEWITFLSTTINLVRIGSNIPIDSALWDGEQRLITYMNIDTEVVFSPKRDVVEQIEDFKLVMEEVGGIERIKRIDLSSPNILVEYR